MPAFTKYNFFHTSQMKYETPKGLSSSSSSLEDLQTTAPSSRHSDSRSLGGGLWTERQISRRRIQRIKGSIHDHFEFLSSVSNTESAIVRKFIPKSSIQQNNSKSSSRPILLQARERTTHVQCIVKILLKATIPPSAGGEKLWRQLCQRLLHSAWHPNLLAFYGIFEDQDHYYLFFENLQGGELFDFLLTENAVPEELCKHIIRQLLLSLEVLHAQNIVHRDVKPENLMFRYGRPSLSYPVQNSHLAESLPTLLSQYELVLIDFDTCRMLDVKSEDYRDWSSGRRRLVGTYGYLAPEILSGGEYSPASDLWSAGVILYVLMTGVPPVPMGVMKNARSSLEALQKLELRGIDFDCPSLLDFPMARDLCIQMLQFNPARRLSSAEQGLQHPWLCSTAALSAKYYCASALSRSMNVANIPIPRLLPKSNTLLSNPPLPNFSLKLPSSNAVTLEPQHHKQVVT